MSTRLVRDVMTWNVVVVNPHTHFKEIVELIGGHGISAVPVVDDAGHVVGVVSEGDLMYKVETGGGEAVGLVTRKRRRIARTKAAGETARDLMSTPVVTVGPDATIAEAARLMEMALVKRLPVVEDDRLVGIVSRRDVLRVYLRSDHDIERDVQDLLRHVLAIDHTEVAARVAAGVVTLTGSVSRRTTAEVALRLVAGVDGVVRVGNELTWSLDDTAKAAARFVTH